MSPAVALPPTAPDPGATPRLPDRATLVAVSALAYLIAVGLHEHLGHATACALLGSRPTELGAFYVNCDDTRLSETRIRLVALAGPLMSLVTGFSCLALARVMPARARTAYYFFWLLGSLGFMTAAGYALFSGVSGIGDFGTGRDGAFYAIDPEWVVRVVLAVTGGVAYVWVVGFCAREIAPHAGGTGALRIGCARRTVLISYFTGAGLSLLIGLLNPYGILIVATSALASSMGGTSGLIWMMKRLDSKDVVPGPGLYFSRSWVWIAIALISSLAYAAIFGPTLWL